MSPRTNRVFRIFAKLAAVGIACMLLLILAYRYINPPYSALMVTNALAGRTLKHKWVKLEDISPYLVSAVVTSEDARFCRHWGVDWAEVEDALEEAEETGRGPRGASTIPMQTVKNLFLWQDRSYVRKAIEIPLAYATSAIWPKQRMLEIYLNVAEWGPGIFGAQAAARYHFRSSAARLTRREAAQLAAALPNPHVRNAGRPGPKTRRLARRMEQRLKKGGAPLDCIYTN
ncbi:MAG: monofunctional biosynthetic peptidoglycan transglycosylase [Hyphomicrobiaceae bacterium]|nr:monofunctional biosynthetic peptidoglycan transglycosylase [Hyphomicrobiaceae bacterium]